MLSVNPTNLGRTMPAPGGPTNQSGIHYQNSIAALYLGRMCDPLARPSRERVCEVRVETLGHVDDIEIKFGHGGRKWLQAKERVRTGSPEWVTAWQSFEAKRFSSGFTDVDRLGLMLGAASTTQEALGEAGRRAANARNADEWWSDLPSEQKSAVDSLLTVISAPHQDRMSMFALLGALDIEIAPAERLHRDWVPYWIPRCRGASSDSLFELLRSKANEGARYRRVFTAPELLLELREQGVEVVDIAPGVAAYRSAVKRCFGRMEVPGTSLAGATQEVFLWPRLRAWERDSNRRIAQREDEFIEEAGESVDPLALPEGAGSRTVIVAAAGAGKSSLLRAIAHRHAESIWVPVLIPLADLARSGRPIATYLDDIISATYQFSANWTDLCEHGTVLLLLDGLDELSLDERSRVLEMVNIFSARFPRVPWILTVRETAALAAPAGAQVLKLQPLRGEDVEAFCMRWLPPERRDTARQVSNAIACSRELRRMARVPLLLSLMVSHAATQHEPLPSRRSDLLERYLKTLLRPAAYKHAPALPNEWVLRAAAERLAFAALETGGIELAVGDIRRAPADFAPETLAGLVACGVVHEQGEAYRFVFPLIQEYLSGCYIVEHLRGEIEERFTRHTSRPWSQALLFALERCEDADFVVNRILDLPDDAFRTTLKTIARCIANGAHVTTATRRRVGDELAKDWVHDGHWQFRVGELLADGYTHPLPEAVRAKIQRGEGLEYGGGAILVALEDDALTEKALRAILEQGFPGHVRSWQAAIDRIASLAAHIYLERAKRPKTKFRERESQWLAYLLAELPTVSASDDPRVQAAKDPLVSPMLRLAAVMKLQTQLDADAKLLIEESLRSYWEHDIPRGSPVFDLLCDAIWRLPDPIATWRASLRSIESAKLYATPESWWLFGRSPQEEYWRSLLLAIATRMPSRAALQHLYELRDEESITGTRLDFLNLTCAFLGDHEAFAALTSRIPDLHRSDMNIWLRLAGRHHPDIVKDGVARLRGARRQDRRELELSIWFRYVVEFEEPFSIASLRARRLHPAAGVGAQVMRSWADDAPRCSSERINFLANALELGDRSIAPVLLREVEARLSYSVLDFNTENALAAAITALANTPHPCCIDMLRRAALCSSHNLAFRAYAQIESCGTLDALDVLIDLYPLVPQRCKEPLETSMERLAHSLGVRVLRNPSGELVRLAR